MVLGSWQRLKMGVVQQLHWNLKYTALSIRVHQNRLKIMSVSDGVLEVAWALVFFSQLASSTLPGTVTTVVQQLMSPSEKYVDARQPNPTWAD